MKSTDYAYAAGYIDGDGCFQVGNQTWGSHFVIVSVRKEPIDWFAQHFDGNIRTLHQKQKNRLPSYHFRFSEKGNQSVAEIAKYLIEKKEEAFVYNQFRQAFGKENKAIFIEKMKFLKNNFGLIPTSIKNELTNIKNTINPTIEDFAYLAGYIDAECSLDISRRMQKKGKTITYRPQLQCNNTKFPFFYWASARFGGQFHFLNKSHIPNNRNQILWRISNKQLEPILHGIYPFLISKKNICEKMIDLRAITIVKNRVSPNHPNFAEWYEPIFTQKEIIYNQVRHFNSI